MKNLPTYMEFVNEQKLKSSKKYITDVIGDAKTSTEIFDKLNSDVKSWDESMEEHVMSTGACEEWNGSLGIVLRSRLGSSIKVLEGTPKNEDDYLPPHYIVTYKDNTILDLTSSQFWGYGLGKKIKGGKMQFSKAEYADIYDKYDWEKIY